MRRGFDVVGRERGSVPEKRSDGADLDLGSRNQCNTRAWRAGVPKQVVAHVMYARVRKHLGAQNP